MYCFRHILRFLIFFFILFLHNSVKSQVIFTSSNLPIVVLNTNGQIIPDENKIEIDMGIIYNGSGQRNYLADPFNEYDGKIGIEVRGSSSQGFPKKQYGFETRDDEGNNLNVPLLGMPEENDWILYAPYSDKSLLRNFITYNLSRKTGRYASRTCFCELVINDDYKGVYILLEKIKRDNNRVDISKMDSDDIAGDSLSGGYIIKIDKWTGSNNDGWVSEFPPYPGAWQDIIYQYHYPKPDEIVTQQKDYIQNVIYEFENFMDQRTGDIMDQSYEDFIDVDSFIDFFIINEIAKNVDGYRLSTFMFKDRESKGGKLTMGPVWDFNLGFGNANYYEGWVTSGWQMQNILYSDYYLTPFYWNKLFEDSEFYKRLTMRWLSFRQTILSNDSILGLIDQTVEYLDESQQRNFQRWPILGVWVWPNYFVGNTYAEEIAFLKNWIEDRLAWMDANLVAPAVINEINYLPCSYFDPGDWVEIFNPNMLPLNISGWKFKDENNYPFFTIPEGTEIDPVGYLILCQDVSKFTALFPDVQNYMGSFNFDLSSDGELIRLFDSQNEIVDCVEYNNTDPWPVKPEGVGFTLELKDFTLDNMLGENWRASALVQGSPGWPNIIPPVCGLFLNEFMADNQNTIADPQGDFDDWIEIYNSSTSSVDIGGLYLTDDLEIPLKYRIPFGNPDSTTIPPKGHLLLWADKDPEDGILHLDFKLSKDGEEIGLFNADGISLIDSVSFGAQQTDISTGRARDGNREWTVWQEPTPGASNMFHQTILFVEGWNSLSTYLALAENNVENIFAPIVNDLVILQSGPFIYWPAQGINTIGNWDIYSAYIAKLENSHELDFAGYFNDNPTVEMISGWNLIPVLCSCPFEIEEFYDVLEDNLVIIKEAVGYKIFWPAQNISTLQYLNPGNAYFVYLNTPCSFTFPAGTK